MILRREDYLWRKLEKHKNI